MTEKGRHSRLTGPERPFFLLLLLSCCFAVYVRFSFVFLVLVVANATKLTLRHVLFTLSITCYSMGCVIQKTVIGPSLPHSFLLLLFLSLTSFLPPLTISAKVKRKHLLQTDFFLIYIAVWSGRAWLLLSLNEAVLEAFLATLEDRPSHLSEYYLPNALLRDSTSLQVVITLVSGLEHVGFDFLLVRLYLLLRFLSTLYSFLYSSSCFFLV